MTSQLFKKSLQRTLPIVLVSFSIFVVSKKAQGESQAATKPETSKNETTSVVGDSSKPSASGAVTLPATQKPEQLQKIVIEDLTQKRSGRLLCEQISKSMAGGQGLWGTGPFDESSCVRGVVAQAGSFWKISVTENDRGAKSGAKAGVQTTAFTLTLSYGTKKIHSLSAADSPPQTEGKRLAVLFLQKLPAAMAVSGEKLIQTLKLPIRNGSNGLPNPPREWTFYDLQYDEATKIWKPRQINLVSGSPWSISKKTSTNISKEKTYFARWIPRMDKEVDAIKANKIDKKETAKKNRTHDLVTDASITSGRCASFCDSSMTMFVGNRFGHYGLNILSSNIHPTSGGASKWTLIEASLSGSYSGQIFKARGYGTFGLLAGLNRYDGRYEDRNGLGESKSVRTSSSGQHAGFALSVGLTYPGFGWVEYGVGTRLSIAKNYAETAMTMAAGRSLMSIGSVRLDGFCLARRSQTVQLEQISTDNSVLLGFDRLELGLGIRAYW